MIKGGTKEYCHWLCLGQGQKAKPVKGRQKKSPNVSSDRASKTGYQCTSVYHADREGKKNKDSYWTPGSPKLQAGLTYARVRVGEGSNVYLRVLGEGGK